MKLPVERVTQLRPFYEGRAVCVTGGAGFIGGHLVDALLSLGASISVIDDLSNSTLEALAGLIELEPDRVRFVHGSVLDDEALEEALAGTEGRNPARTVFHLAALGSVQRSIEQPQRTWSVNATGTLRVLEASRKARAERVVLAASSAYGDQPELPRAETQLPRPQSPYAASKVAGEQLCATWANCYGLSTVALRFFNIFGPRQQADSQYAGVIASFARKALAGESPLIYGDGSQTRDFTFVGNAVLAALLAGANKTAFKGEVMNIGTGRRTSIADLAVLVAQRCGVSDVRPDHKPVRQGDVQHSVADIRRARELIGYEPFARLEDGLTETVEWFKKSRSEGARTESR
jgi:nucleoside-diphosphate-sugar epimerase